MKIKKKKVKENKMGTSLSSMTVIFLVIYPHGTFSEYASARLLLECEIALKNILSGRTKVNFEQVKELQWEKAIRL